MLDQLPPAPVTDTTRNHAAWEQWQQGLTKRITLPALLPLLRLLLVWDNLKGHVTPALVLWLFSHGVMPLYTPLGRSWLNMAESRQAHHQPPGPGRTIFRHRNRSLMHWKRRSKDGTRRRRLFIGVANAMRAVCAAGCEQHALAGSGACTCRPLRHRPSALQKSLFSCQVTQ